MMSVFVAMLVVFLIGLMIAFAASLVAAIPVWLVWNWIGPDVFHGPAITFWQTWGVLFLVGVVLALIRTKASTTTSR